MPAVVLRSVAPLPVPFSHCGAMGKITAVGDFIRFDVTGDFAAVWDDWLQSGLVAVGDFLRDRWHDCYMAAPIWRFTVAPGVAGPSAYLGVLMPSTDRVGRTFPLTLVMRVPPDANLAEVHFQSCTMFEALEDIALATLDELPLVEFKRRCAGIGQTQALAAWDPAPALAAKHVRQVAGQCLWSARLPDGFRLLRSDGLPDHATFAGMFDANAAIWTHDTRVAGVAS